jgi:hypothetical protein
MYKKHLEILKLTLKATQKGKLKWEEFGDDQFHCKVKGERAKWIIRYKYPMFTNDEGSDKDIAEVMIGRAMMTFYSGTEGRYLVDEIISFAKPEFIGHRKRVEGFIDETLSKLENI